MLTQAKIFSWLFATRKVARNVKLRVREKSQLAEFLGTVVRDLSVPKLLSKTLIYTSMGGRGYVYRYLQHHRVGFSAVLVIKIRGVLFLHSSIEMGIFF